MSTEIAIIRKENVELIAQTAAGAYTENQVSRQRCLDCGNALLAEIQQDGMTDDLDRRAAEYIERSRKTVKKMFEKRSPATKLLDEVRTKFCALENEITPNLRGTVPNQIQQFRNEYAAKKRAEEEARRRAAYIEQERINSMSKYRNDIDDENRRLFNGILNNTVNTINRLLASCTLDNYEATVQAITGTPTTLDEAQFKSRSSVPLPSNVGIDELRQIRDECLSRTLSTFQRKYTENVEQTKADCLAMLPSKKLELERIAKASAEDAERIRLKMAEQEAAEAARREAERLGQQAKEQQAADMAKQNDEINGLFSQQAASVQTYQPKTSVKKRLVLLNPEGIMPVISMWWIEEGCHLTCDELTKMFKKQITLCEKLANREDSKLIADENITYEDEVKAK